MRVNGIATATQSKKLRRRPPSSRTIPIAIRFGGEPTGMPTATDDDQVSISMSPIGKRLWALSPAGPKPRSRPRPTGSMIAVVAVLLTQRDSAHVIVPSVASSRRGVRVAHSRRRSANAKRVSSPLLRIAAAMMKLPMNRKITGSAYGASTARAGATPNAMASTEASSAVTARGSAAVIQ